MISGVTGRALLEDNEIREVDGAGTVAMERIHATGTFDAHWRNEGGADRYWGTGALNFDWGMGSESGRGITGAGVSATLNEDQSFEATGTLQYAINENMKGDLQITVDQNWDPELAGSFDAHGTIMEGKELFKKEMQLIPHTAVPIVGPLGIAFGMLGSMGMTLNPMTYDFHTAISNFHPLNADVPDFEASLGLDWGVNFFGALAPYLGIGVALPILTATAGVRGQVRLDAPVNFGIDGSVFGRGGEFGGDLGVSAGVTPTLSLSVIPYVEASAFGQGATWEFGNYPIASMDLFTVEWGTTYHFGDSGPSTSSGASQSVAPTQPAAAPMTLNAASNTAAPSLGVGNSSSGPSGLPGMPQVGGSDVSSESGTSGGLDGIMEKANRVSAIAAGVGAMSNLIDLGLSSWNLPALAVRIATNWDAIAADVRIVINAISVAAEWISELLPGWFFELKQVIQDGLGVLQGAFNLVMDGVNWVVDGVGSLMPWNW